MLGAAVWVVNCHCHQAPISGPWEQCWQMPASQHSSGSHRCPASSGTLSTPQAGKMFLFFPRNFFKMGKIKSQVKFKPPAFKNNYSSHFFLPLFWWHNEYKWKRDAALKFCLGDRAPLESVSLTFWQISSFLSVIALSRRQAWWCFLFVSGLLENSPQIKIIKRIHISHRF